MYVELYAYTFDGTFKFGLVEIRGMNGKAGLVYFLFFSLFRLIEGG